MNKQTLVNMCVVAALVLSVAPLTEASAWGGRGRFDEDVFVGRQRYHYRDGRFYRPTWFGFNLVIGTPPFGAVVTTLPYGCRTVFINGASYYYYDGIYYRRYPTGYVVVPTPVVQRTVVPVQGSAYETVTINIPNNNGTFTPVTLVRQSNGYTGPQGEYYPNRPTVEQLRVLYGN